MTLLLQQVLNGVANGCIYAGLALALVLIYRCTQYINFAQGEMAMMSTYLVWWLTTLGLNVWIALLVAMVASFAAGAALERVLINRFDPKDHLVLVIVAVGLFFALNGLAQFVFGADGKLIPNLFPTDVLDLAGVRVPVPVLGNLAVLLAIGGGLWALFRFTKVGLGFRAIASNRESSSLSGLPVGLLLAAAWGLAAALGAVAGVLLTSLGVFLNPNMMVAVLVYAFSAAVLGGLDSPVGAVVGGIVLGVLESLAAAYVSFIGSDLKIILAFAVIVVVLLVRPHGLFGSAEVSRV